MLNTIQSLSVEQGQAVRDMGFSTLLLMKTDHLPTAMSYFVVGNFDTKEMVLKVEKGGIKADRRSVRRILGLPMGANELSNLPVRPEEDDCYDKWRSQFENPENIKLNDVKDAIITRPENDLTFKMNFIVLFYNTLVVSTGSDKIIETPIQRISSVTDFKNLDWCSEVIKSLKASKTSFKPNSKTYCYKGPLTYLVVSLTILCITVFHYK